MALTARSIDVNAPLRAVYDQWTRFEEFPLFMEGVEEVRLESEFVEETTVVEPPAEKRP
jgi:uncharacterized membrane protein